MPLNDQLICQGDSIQLGISIPAWNISWSPSNNISNSNSPNPYFYPTTSTRYYLQFVDSVGCTQYDTVDINVKICCAARARFKVSDSAICFGNNVTITNQCKGTITSYNWNFGNAIPNIHNTANPPIISFSSGGYYPLRLIVSNGICFDTMIKNISVIQFKPYAGRDSSSCMANLTVNLGEDAISTWDYNWVPSSNLNDSKISNPVCTILNDSVTYIVEAKDQWSGCKFYDTVTIKTNIHIDTFSSTNRICFGDSVNFNSTYIKQTGRYFYTIKTVNGLCDSILYLKYVDVLNPRVNTYSAETYCDYYIDSKGKRHVVSFVLNDTIKSKTMNCDSLVNVRTINIYKAVTAVKELKACNEVVFKGKKYRTSQNKIDSTKIKGIVSGCDSLITVYNVVILPNPKATISASKSNPIMLKESVVLTANGGGTYRWTFNNSTNQSIVHRALDTHSKKYIVRVTDTSTTCWDSAVYIVQAIYPDTCYYGIPNVFTPNGDGLNDVFIPNMDDCTDLKLFVIYNRWGEKMFETNEKKGWDGNYKNHLAPYGVYVYYIEFNTLWGIRIYKGSVTLIR